MSNCGWIRIGLDDAERNDFDRHSRKEKDSKSQIHKHTHLDLTYATQNENMQTEKREPRTKIKNTDK